MLAEVQAALAEEREAFSRLQRARAHYLDTAESIVNLVYRRSTVDALAAELGQAVREWQTAIGKVETAVRPHAIRESN